MFCICVAFAQYVLLRVSVQTSSCCLNTAASTKNTDHSVNGLLYDCYIIACKPLVRLISGSTFTQACRSEWNPKCCPLVASCTHWKWCKMLPGCCIFWPFQAKTYHSHFYAIAEKNLVQVLSSVSCAGVWSLGAWEEVKGFGHFGWWL